MGSVREFPNNKTGAQWPDQIQKSTGISVVKIRSKKRGNAELRRRRRLPEDHPCARRLLEQPQKRYRPASETDHIPQPQQPTVALG